MTFLWLVTILLQSGVLFSECVHMFPFLIQLSLRFLILASVSSLVTNLLHTSTLFLHQIPRIIMAFAILPKELFLALFLTLLPLLEL